METTPARERGAGYRGNLTDGIEPDQEGQAHALALRTFQKANLELGEDVRIIPVDYGAVLAQLERGDATLAMVLEPAASSAEAEGATVVYSYPRDWGDFAFTELTTTERELRERGEKW